MVTTFFGKYLENPQILKSRVSASFSNFKSRVSELLMKSWSRNFNEVSVSKVAISTTSMIKSTVVLAKKLVRKIKSMQRVLVALQQEKLSSFTGSILILIISLFGCLPAVDAQDRRPVRPAHLCTPLVLRNIRMTILLFIRVLKCLAVLHCCELVVSGRFRLQFITENASLLALYVCSATHGPTSLSC